MSANKSNYHQPLKENKLWPLLCFHAAKMDGMDGESCSVAELGFLFMDNREILASLKENSSMKKIKTARSKAGLHGDVRSQPGKTLVMSVDIRGSKEHQNDPLSHTFWPTPLGPSTNTSPAEKQPPLDKKTATYQQRECTQWFIHSFKRTWNLGSISVPASLCVRCTAEQRDLVGLSSLIFLLVFLCVFSLSLSPLSLSDLSHHMETKVMADWNIIEV